MATWQDLSRDNLQVAKSLLAEGHWRSSINRSYYAAYCAISHELVARGVRFPYGWHNPAHEQLPALIRNGLPLPPNTRRRLSSILRVLRRAREDADYRPTVFVDRTLARDCVRDAVTVLEEMEVI